MTSLDYKYLDTVLADAREGDSNAFAEIYAATYAGQYEFAMEQLCGNEFDAEDTLQETYIYALTNILQITSASMLLPWLYQVNFRICNGKRMRAKGIDNPESETVEVKSFRPTIARILRLPLTQSQALIMCYACGMSMRRAARFMDMRVPALRSYRREALRTLAKEDGV